MYPPEEEYVDETNAKLEMTKVFARITDDKEKRVWKFLEENPEDSMRLNATKWSICVYSK